VTQHAALTEERWRAFREPQRILMIANEMERGRRFLVPGEERSLKLGYERVLRLVDLTVGVTDRNGLRRELLRWRDIVAELFLAATPDRAMHESALRVLLLFSGESASELEPLGLRYP
jgi:hypothetical protein